jgi:glycosyltransferase involved in cell wall biosynthesis
VGTGPEADRLQRLADELSLQQRVLFLGNRSNVQPFMQAADCLASPAVWEEAAGLVNLEGLACGLPVVASRSGGIPEIVEDGRTGLLVAPDDAGALSNAIDRLYKEPALHARMAREARRVAVERYAVEKRLPDFLDLYRR